MSKTARAVARPPVGRSLVGRLVWLAAGWSVALLIATGTALTLFFHQAALAEFNEGLAEDINTLLAGSSVGPQGQVLAPALIDARAERVYSGKYWTIAEPAPGKRGKLQELARSRSLWDANPITVPPAEVAAMTAAKDQTVFFAGEGPLQQPLRGAARLTRLPGRAAPVVFVVAEDASHLARDDERFAVTTALALLLLGAGVILAVVVQVRVGLQPLFAMGREVAGVRQGAAQRVTGVYPRELSPLAGELNALLDHNQDVVERQRTHVGNLAHALKNPISVLLAETEGSDTPLAEVVARQSELMRRHVEHHLRRARAAARSQTSGERTHVAEALDEMVRMFERIHAEKAVAIDWDADDDLAFQGEQQDFMELAGNLIENACNWCRRKVRVTTAREDPSRFVLVVEDDGPGLPASEREAVLRRGVRLDESAPGSGLGLAIVDELARAYGGSLVLDDARLGGLKATLHLPRAG